MCNHSTTAVRSCSLPSPVLAVAWSFIGLRRRDVFSLPFAAPGKGRVLAAALAGIAVLTLCLLAVAGGLIVCLPAVVHLFVH